MFRHPLHSTLLAALSIATLSPVAFAEESAYRPNTVMDTVDHGDVQWTDGFWADRARRVENVTLPRLWELAEPFAWNNMLVAAGEKEGQCQGCNWEDAWIYKWIEAAAYTYARTKDPRLLDQMDAAIAVIAKAQQPDGYLATQNTLRGRPRFTQYNEHEVYTMGHLLTAASVHHRITGRDNFLNVARRTADFLHHEYTTSDNPYLINCPVNPSAIMGAVELYRETGDKKYLALANILIDNRGKKRPPVPPTSWGAAGGNSDLNQDRTPLRQSSEVVGHAVFWSYLFAGAADAYMETGDESLMKALDRLWTDLTTSKTYITGGVSPVHKGLSNRSNKPGERTILKDEVHEAVGLPYDLPNATAYNETCGQIGNLMWNWRMLQITGDAKYADLMERTLYNSILCGVNVSGEGWSYTNPLRWHGVDHELLSNDFHGRMNPGAHQICCPTNLMRLEASWDNYLYTTSDDALWVHQFGASEATIDIDDDTSVRVAQETNYPWDGKITLRFEEVRSDGPFAVRFRIPEWAKGASWRVNDQPATPITDSGVYTEWRRPWRSGDVLTVDLPMPVRLMAANSRLEQARNQVAVMRGPVVYCLESRDLPEGVSIEDVQLASPLQSATGRNFEPRFDAELLGGVVVLEGTGYVVDRPSKDAPLYEEWSPRRNAKPIPLRLIPYYAWNNRGEPEMTVWLPILNPCP